MGIFSQYRTEDFWWWRYLDSQGFRYHFFGDPETTGVVVARMEVIYAEDVPELHGKRMLRIIEVVPKDLVAWQRKPDKSLHQLIEGVLGWGAEHDCIAADFYCSHSRFDSVFESAGFRKQDGSLGPAECSIPLWFQPLSYAASPINALFRIALPVGLVSVPWEDVHMVKSENDQDRPNLCEGSMVLDNDQTYNFREPSS
jgi:hypothetical protein